VRISLKLSFALGLAEGARWRERKPRIKDRRAETDPLITSDIE